MATQESPTPVPPSPGLPPTALTTQRDTAAAELVKALLIINGGGAVALLAFLQAIWVPSRELAKPTIIAVTLLAAGALAAAAFHLLRYHASWHHQTGDTKSWAKFRRLYVFCATISLIAFLIAVIVVSVGVLAVL